MPIAIDVGVDRRGRYEEHLRRVQKTLWLRCGIMCCLGGCYDMAEA